MDEILRGSSSPPLKRIVNFVVSKLPLGMGLLKLGNFLYMFGGEYHHNEGKIPNFEGEINSDSDLDIDLSHCFRVYGVGLLMENPPSPMYRLDLIDTNNRSEPIQVSSMLGLKLYVIV